VYQELEISSKRKGEFFTPYALSKAMAQMLFDKERIQMAIDEKGFVSIGEPACGAGGMLIAASEVIEELGFDPRRMVFFEATDINRLCFDMTYIQLSVLGIPGFVCHGNSLTQEMWTRRPTPQLQLSLKRHEVEPAAWKMLSLLSELKPTQVEEVHASSLPVLPSVGDTKDEDKFSQLAKSEEETPRQLDLFLDWQGDGGNQ
jgi:8-oxo-dGTP pyrophosphatase MutT (NUDIX family)